MVEVRKRESNFELLRIVSMIMIIMWHLLLQGGFYDNAQGVIRLFFVIVEAIIVVHVNSFVLLTGYFQSNSSFKLKKVLSIILLVWFYKISVLFLMLFLHKYNANSIDFFKCISPINYQDYWFISTYVLLYLLSPLLNIVIKNIDMKKFKIVLILLFLIFSILPTITMQEAYNNNHGYSLGNFILLYFIGAYIRKRYSYKEKILKKYTINAKKIIILLLFFMFASYNFLLYIFSDYIANYSNDYLNYLSLIIKHASFSYDNPIVIFQSIIYLVFFGLLQIRSKTINIISKTTFGVYLIHTNKLLRVYVYKIFGFNAHINSGFNMLKFLILNSIILFSICALIELIRVVLFHVLRKNNIYKKIRDKLLEYFDSLGMKISW